MTTRTSTGILAILVTLVAIGDAFATDIKITKTALTKQVMVGDLVMFQFVADNTSQTGGGPLETQSTTITDQLPPELEYVSAEGASCSVDSGNKVTCQVGGLAKGEKRTVTVTLRALAAGTVVNEAKIETDLFDPDPSNNSDSDTITITPAAGELSIAGVVLEHVNYNGGKGIRTGAARPGATVELYDGGGAFREATTTGSDGVFAFVMPGARIVHGAGCQRDRDILSSANIKRWARRRCNGQVCSGRTYTGSDLADRCVIRKSTTRC